MASRSIHLYLLVYPLCIFVPLTAMYDYISEHPLADRLMTITLMSIHTGAHFEGDNVHRKKKKHNKD